MRDLAAEAEASPPGAKGLVVLPYFSGERTPIHDPHAKGVLFGLNLTHTRGDIFRAVLEGIACGTNHIIETYGEAANTPRKIFAVGGGTRTRSGRRRPRTFPARPRSSARRPSAPPMAMRSWRRSPSAMRSRRHPDLEPGRLGIHRQQRHAEIYRHQYGVFRQPLRPQSRSDEDAGSCNFRLPKTVDLVP